MEAVTPELHGTLILIAESQPEYQTVMALKYTNPLYGAPREYNTLVLAFRPSAEEMRTLAHGGDLYIALLTFGGPMQAINVMAGKEDAGRVLGLQPVK